MITFKSLSGKPRSGQEPLGSIRLLIGALLPRNPDGLLCRKVPTCRQTHLKRLRLRAQEDPRHKQVRLYPKPYHQFQMKEMIPFRRLLRTPLREILLEHQTELPPNPRQQCLEMPPRKNICGRLRQNLTRDVLRGRL